MNKNHNRRINNKKVLNVKMKNKKLSGNQPKSTNQEVVIMKSLKKRKKRNRKIFLMKIIN